MDQPSTGRLRSFAIESAHGFIFRWRGTKAPLMVTRSWISRGSAWARRMHSWSVEESAHACMDARGLEELRR